jgi:hypothetical protein
VIDLITHYQVSDRDKDDAAGNEAKVSGPGKERHEERGNDGEHPGHSQRRNINSG